MRITGTLIYVCTLESITLIAIIATTSKIANFIRASGIQVTSILLTLVYIFTDTAAASKTIVALAFEGTHLVRKYNKISKQKKTSFFSIPELVQDA